jgi:tyrosinase
MASKPHLIRYDIWELNQGRVAAFPVKGATPGWDPISLYYALALKAMGWRKSPDGNTDVESMWPYSDAPDSYFFQAAMHWWPKYQGIPPSPYDERWSHCTHGPASSENYFLAWHRGFIYFFEVIVRGHVKRLGGPDGWALPYWNYSHYNASTPAKPWDRSNLPWVFSQAKLPDGSENPLCIADRAKRGLQPQWPPPHKPETMYLETQTPYYDQAYAHRDFLGFNATLDGRPHGAVHDDTGSGDGSLSSTGWMQNTVTASFDPIFWLHHSEIDRFWVGWNAAGHGNPSDPTWLNASDDPQRRTRWNFWEDGNLAKKIVVHPGQMLDPAGLADPFPHTYAYQSMPTYPPPHSPGTAQLAAAVPRLLSRPPALGGAPQQAAAAGPLQLGHEPVSTTVAVHEQAQSAVARLAELDEAPESPHVLLHLEGVVAEGPPGNYEIYLNYPDADRETAGSVPHYVGLLAGFGADHHHDHGDGEDGGGHEGHEGASASYDITAIVAYLQAHGGWNESEATVTFVPAARPREGFELQTAGLRVGSVSIETV